MVYEQFTWCPRIDPESTNTFRVHSAQFGDGYVQEVGDGINTESQSWPLEFVGREGYIQPIRDFLRAHSGFKPFLWTPPMDIEGLYVCREFKLKAMGGKLYTLTATFEQRFAP